MLRNIPNTKDPVDPWILDFSWTWTSLDLESGRATFGIATSLALGRTKNKVILCGVLEIRSFPPTHSMFVYY